MTDLGGGGARRWAMPTEQCPRLALFLREEGELCVRWLKRADKAAMSDRDSPPLACVVLLSSCCLSTVQAACCLSSVAGTCCLFGSLPPPLCLQPTEGHSTRLATKDSAWQRGLASGVAWAR